MVAGQSPWGILFLAAAPISGVQQRTGHNQVLPRAKPLSDLANHSLIFVGGLGGSGTSFLRHLLAEGNNMTSGQDSCLQYAKVNCKSFNEEGQWFLHGLTNLAKKMRAVYAPGDSFQPLTEQNISFTDTDLNASTLLSYFWNAWSPYWDTSKPYLIEKSPPNLLKSRFLTSIFSPAKSVRFLFLIRDPVTNSRFSKKAPVVMKDVIKEFSHPTSELKPFPVNMNGFQDQPTVALLLRGSPAWWRNVSLEVEEDGDGEEGKVKSNTATTETPLKIEVAGQRQAEALLLARLSYVREWVMVHETLLRQLRGWPKGKEVVRVIRYEQMGAGMLEAQEVCKAVYKFSFSEEKAHSTFSRETLVQACSLQKTCSQEKFEERMSRLRKKNSKSSRGYGKHRILKYRGGDCTRGEETSSSGSPVHFKEDTTSIERLLDFRRFLASSMLGRSNVTRAAIAAIEPRLKPLGYSLADPGNYRPASLLLARSSDVPQLQHDVFGPWSLRWPVNF